MNCLPDGLYAKIVSSLRRVQRWGHVHAKTLKSVIWIVFSVCVLGALTYYFVRDWQRIRTYPWQLHWVNVVSGFGIYSVSIMLTALVWSLIMYRISHIRSLGLHIHLFCLTNLAQRLPTPFPYVGARTEAYAAKGVARSATLLGMTIERVVTLLGALAVAVLTLPFGSYYIVLSRFSPFILSLGVIPLALLAIRPAWLLTVVNFVLVRFKRAPLQAEIYARDMLLWMGLFIVTWLNGGLLYYFLGTSVYSMSPGDLLFIIHVFALSGIAGQLGQILFFLPNLAVRQLVIAYLLSFRVPWHVAVVIALLTRLCVMVFELIWALLSIAWTNISLNVRRKREVK